MSRPQTCCTCASFLTDTKVPYDTATEKPICLDRKVDCCDRVICATCQYNNPRFQNYCPFCQISSAPTALPSTGLRLPPSYTESRAGRNVDHDLPPSYDALDMASTLRSGLSPPSDTPDVVHFLSSSDSVHSLSLAYSVPASVLRQHNNLYQDSLLAGRKFILVPHEHYQGAALSTPPDPVEEERKNKIRRWMTTTKCADYNVAVLYLTGSEYDLEVAIEAFNADESWEKEHPLEKGKGKGKARHSSKRIGSSSLVGQLS